MNAAEIIAIVNSWQKEKKNVSFTFYDGDISALVFADGDAHRVRGRDFEQFVEQADNLLNDKVYKDCRSAPLVIK